MVVRQSLEWSCNVCNEPWDMREKGHIKHSLLAQKQMQLRKFGTVKQPP